MSVNYSLLILLPVYDMFARPVTFCPYKSQPGAGAYNARGIYDSDDINIVGEDEAIFSDQQTILDIRAIEFAVTPLQGDHVYIEADGPNMPAQGEFEILDTDDNGGGEITLTLRKWLPPKP